MLHQAIQWMSRTLDKYIHLSNIFFHVWATFIHDIRKTNFQCQTSRPQHISTMIVLLSQHLRLHSLLTKKAYDRKSAMHYAAMGSVTWNCSRQAPKYYLIAIQSNAAIYTMDSITSVQSSVWLFKIWCLSRQCNDCFIIIQALRNIQTMSQLYKQILSVKWNCIVMDSLYSL